MRCASSSGLFKDSLCRLTAAMLLALTLAACGGGGGGEAPTPTPAVTTLRGVALDGYLHRARVCLDVNGNGRCDSGELSTETAADGSFSLQAPEAQAASAALIVEVIPGTTIDSDSGPTPVMQAMRLTAPIGSSAIISPLTTLVAARMVNGEGLDLARSAVSTWLGLPSSLLMADYVAGQADAEAAAAHRVAVAVARVIVGIEADVDPSSTFKSRLESLRNQVATTVVPKLGAIRSAQTLEDVRRTIDDAIFEETASYPVGGQVQGLVGSGLKLAQAGVVIDVSAESQGFEFAAKQPAGADYQIEIVAQPGGQSCSIENATGTVTEDLSERVVVRCQSSTGRLSGTVAGLTAPGLELANGDDRISIPLGASSFRFDRQINAGAAFSVQVINHPAGQFCSVARGAGSMVTEGVNDVDVTCSVNAYGLGGVVRGLTAEGLQLAQGGETLTVNAGASSFQFPTRLAFGSAYSVTISRQPSGLYCSLSDSAGVVGLASVQSVEVACEPEGRAYTVGGTVSGLDESGLVIRLGNETLALSAGASSFQFAAPIADGGRYAVGIETQPEFSSCSLLLGSGIVTGGNVSNVSVSCRKRSLYALSSSGLDIIDMVNGQSKRLALPGATYTAIATAPPSPYVLVGDSFSQLHVIDDRTGAPHPASPINVGVSPASVVLDPSGMRAYLVNERANAVTVVDMSDPNPVNWRILDPIPVGLGPVAAYASTVQPHLYVVNRADQSVSVIHTGSLSVIRTYSGLGASPSAITAGPGETMLYIADEGGRSLIRLDLSNGRTTARELNITRGALVRSPDGRRIFTLNEKYVGEDLFDNVTRLDTATWLTTAIDRLPTVTVGDSPLAIAISAGGSRIYTAELTEPSGVSVIDSGTMTVTKRIPVNFLPVGIVVK